MLKTILCRWRCGGACGLRLCPERRRRNLRRRLPPGPWDWVAAGTADVRGSFHAYLVDATEAAEMDVANIVEGVWTIPASRAKNSTPLAIPLNANMLATITSTRKSVTRGYIKPSAAVLKARELAKLALKRDAFDRWAERLREIIG